MNDTDLSPFRSALRTWFDAARADLPWRRDHDPYRVWLSEIMLQQTQVNAVIPYYERFLASFPDIQTLAAAPLDRVLKLWEGLGYYSRARNLHKTAQTIAVGNFPTTAADLMKLPGIGRYTAAAIASICYGEQVAVLDGNVIRVLSRLLDYAEDVTRPAAQSELWKQAERLLDPKYPGDHNQAMMELGRTICRPRNPLCLLCPVRSYCAAFLAGTQALRPVKSARKPIPHLQVAAAVTYRDDGRFLIAQRKPEGLLGGLWEFPGGKQEADESLEQCVARELHEELAIQIAVREKITVVEHAFTHFRITLHAFRCEYLGSDNGIAPQTIGCADYRWVTLDDVDEFAFGKADLGVIAALRALRR